MDPPASHACSRGTDTLVAFAFALTLALTVTAPPIAIAWATPRSGSSHDARHR